VKNQGNSMQPQNPNAQAQQSLDHLHNSVAMAQSHPDAQMIQQAENSLEKAERSVAQMEGESKPQAVQLAQSELREEQENLQSLQ